MSTQCPHQIYNPRPSWWYTNRNLGSPVGASLTALRNKDGGIRQIAVECTHHRLVAKVASCAVNLNLRSPVPPSRRKAEGMENASDTKSHAQLLAACGQRDRCMVKCTTTHGLWMDDEKIYYIFKKFLLQCREAMQHLSWGVPV